MKITLYELAEILKAQLIGDPDYMVIGPATLTSAGPENFTFITSAKYRSLLNTCQAGVVIGTQSELKNYSGNSLIVPSPYVSYAKAAAIFAPVFLNNKGVHPSAVIDSTVTLPDRISIGANSVIEADVLLANDVAIGAGCFIGRHCEIGESTSIGANVSVYHECSIGRNSIVHSGAVIGADGFGFANDNGCWLKVPQLGRVCIGNNVEIGANTTVDRGAIEDTVVKDGAKIDNLVQIAHNVHVGANTAIAGCVGIAGSTRIGENCAIAGGVGLLGHLEIVDGVTVTAMSMVTKSIMTPGVYSSGTPLEDNKQWHKNFVRFKQLDDMARRVRQLEKQLKSIKED